MKSRSGFEGGDEEGLMNSRRGRWPVKENVGGKER